MGIFVCMYLRTMGSFFGSSRVKPLKDILTAAISDVIAEFVPKNCYSSFFKIFFLFMDQKFSSLIINTNLE